MSKKSWLERAGLIKSEGGDQDYTVEELQEMVKQQHQLGSNLTTMNFTSAPEVEVNSEDLLTVEEIYQQFSLEDLSKSIFKVDEFAKFLDTMPSDARRQALVGILAASGLEIETLQEDAQKRFNALNSVSQQVAQQTTEIINQSQTDIAALEQQIDNLKKTINDRKSLQEQQEKLVQAEVEHINTIVKFVG